MKPDASTHNTDPKYQRDLILSANMTQDQLAAAVGVTDKTIRNWISGRQKWPYAAQFCVECIVLQP